MVPLCAQAQMDVPSTDVPSTTENIAAFRSHAEPDRLENKRETFKAFLQIIQISISTFNLHIYIVLNPEAFKKLYRRFEVGSKWVESRFKEDLYECKRAELAGLAAGRMGKHVPDAAHVDADCGEDSPGSCSAGEPFLECGPICKYARLDDFAHTVSRQHV